MAYDGIRDADDLLAALERKGKITVRAQSELCLFESSSVVVRAYEAPRADEMNDARACDVAGAWLAGLVQRDGSIISAIDGRTSAGTRVGEGHYARAAIVIAALFRHGVFQARARAARARLTRDLKAALGGAAVPGFPRTHALVASTLALACLAGAPLRAALTRIAETTDALLGSPWCAAQVVCALGTSAPRALYAACVRDLSREPVAPWTAIAAHAIGDEATYARVAIELARAIKSGAPHEGGYARKAGDLPEIAMTAAVVEALSLRPLPETRAAIRRAHEFLRRAQLLPSQTPACVDPRTAHGAFPLTPTAMLLRADVTAHALLALMPSRSTERANAVRLTCWVAAWCGDTASRR